MYDCAHFCQSSFITLVPCNSSTMLQVFRFRFRFNTNSVSYHQQLAENCMYHQGPCLHFETKGAATTNDLF